MLMFTASSISTSCPSSCSLSLRHEFILSISAHYVLAASMSRPSSRGRLPRVLRLYTGRFACGAPAPPQGKKLKTKKPPETCHCLKRLKGESKLSGLAYRLIRNASLPALVSFRVREEDRAEGTVEAAEIINQAISQFRPWTFFLLALGLVAYI